MCLGRAVLHVPGRAAPGAEAFRANVTKMPAYGALARHAAYQWTNEI